MSGPSTPVRPRLDWDVVVIGAGAAGLVAAERAAARGKRTLLLEKNRRPGIKILMSGGTRCNLTQATDARGIVSAFGPPGRFLHSALAQLGPQDLVALVENEGVPTKIEATGKIFPVSNRAADVLRAFMARLDCSGCTLALGESVTAIERLDDGFRLLTANRTTTAAKLIIATGGRSYPGSGTTGDAYAWARDLGHRVVEPRPALVPIVSSAGWVPELMGLTIDDVALTLIGNDSPGQRSVIDRRRGSLLFAHFGLSGPVALDISRGITAVIDPLALALEIDFLPAHKGEPLDTYLQQEIKREGKRQVISLIANLLPRRLAATLAVQAGISEELRAAELSKSARIRLIELIKSNRLPVTGTRGFEKAEVTAGGVALDEVDSSTMESRLVPGLYWVGEVLDLDGPIGGYNFQAAFSTGWLAGLYA